LENSQMIMALGRVGGVVCVKFAGKSSSDGNLPKVCEADNADLSNLFQICSSNAFGLASPPVSLKPSGLDHCRERKTNPRASLSHCVRSRASRAEKSPRLGGTLSNSLSARSLGTVERSIPNSEQYALCQSGRAKVAAAACRGPHRPINAHKCDGACAGAGELTPPYRPQPRSSLRRCCGSLVRPAPSKTRRRIPVAVGALAHAKPAIRRIG